MYLCGWPPLSVVELAAIEFVAGVHNDAKLIWCWLNGSVVMGAGGGRRCGYGAQLPPPTYRHFHKWLNKKFL